MTMNVINEYQVVLKFYKKLWSYLLKRDINWTVGLVKLDAYIELLNRVIQLKITLEVSW